MIFKATISKKNIWKIFFFISFILLFQLPTLAQTATLKSRVLDKATEEPLVGANAIIDGTSLGAASDLDGRFIIRNVPLGKQKLIISYIGYNSITIELDVKSNNENVDYYLEPKTLEGETVVITAQAEGQLSAINQQLMSNTIANIVAKDRIKELPDVNAAETIGRLPGVSIERSGGEANRISIRGLEPKYNTITVNGVRLPSTGNWDRSVDLSLISSNMLDGITLKKANTPDMDADAFGGTVDLKLKEAPQGLKLNLSAQGGYNELQDYYGNYNFTGSVSDRFFNDELGVIANFNFDNYDRSADKFSANYVREDKVNVGVQVKPSNVSLRDESVTKGRTGASLLLDYRIPNGKITSNGFYNNLNTLALNRINFMNVQYNRHEYNLEEREGNTSVFTGAAGIEQDFEWIKYDLAISSTSSISDNPEDFIWSFIQENGSFETGEVFANMDPARVLELQKIDTLNTGLKSVYINSTKLKENENALQLNTLIPFALGTDFKGYIKFGGKFRWLTKDNNQEQWGRDNVQYGGVGYNSVVAPVLRYLSSVYPNDWDFISDSILAADNAVFPISRFLTTEQSSKFLNGAYDFGFMVDKRLLSQFTEALKATSLEYPNNWLYYSIGSDGYDYHGIEHYQSAYLMGEISYQNLITIIPGFRYEKDFTRYDGQRFQEISSGGVQLPPRGFKELSITRNNDFFLPMVHVIVNPLDWLKIRFARTETLSRPDFVQIAPITTIDLYSSYIRANNSTLKPSRSQNYDLAVQVYENYTGFFTVSAFHKKIDNLIVAAGYDLSPGLTVLEGLNIPETWYKDTTNGRTIATPYIDTYVNNPNPAYYKGFELEWQTHFWYLPSFLQGLVLNINYSRIYSEIARQVYFNDQDIIITPGRPPRTVYSLIDTIRTSRMPYQPSHILNVTLGYDYEGFSARLSYLYQANKTTYIANYSTLDNVAGIYERWDLTLQQKLSWGLQLFVNLTNLNKQEDKNYRGELQSNSSYIEYYGFTMDFGIRFSL